MKKINKKIIAIVSLFVAVIIIWVIIIFLLYTRKHIFLIPVLVFITAVLVIIESKLPSPWDNKKEGWIFWIVGVIVLSAILIAVTMASG